MGIADELPVEWEPGAPTLRLWGIDLGAGSIPMSVRAEERQPDGSYLVAVHIPAHRAWAGIAMDRQQYPATFKVIAVRAVARRGKSTIGGKWTGASVLSIPIRVLRQMPPDPAEPSDDAPSG